MSAIDPGAPLDAQSAPNATSPGQRGAGLTAQIAWVVSDGARAPYSSLITLFVFSAYFTTVVAGEPVRGQALWSYTVATAALIVAIGAPIMGPIADAGGRLKPWLAAFLVLGVPCIASLWFAVPSMSGSALWWIIVALIGSKVSIEYCNVYLNALLPRVAPPGRVGLLSGLGLMSSNVINFAVLLGFLAAWSWAAHPLFGLDASLHEPQRAAGPITALVLALFSLPIFFLAPDAPRSALSASQAVRSGLASLAHSVQKARAHPNAALFLLARMVYNEGFIITMLFTGIFAAGVLKWTPTMLVVQGLMNSTGAILAGMAAGWLDRRIGSKATTSIFILTGTLSSIILATVTPERILFFIDLAPVSDGSLYPRVVDRIFVAVSILGAISVTGGFASSRALMAKLSPANMLADFFSLYALSGTTTSFIGPLAIGIMTSIFHNQRAGVSIGILFFAVGFLLLLPVKEAATAPPQSATIT